MKTPHGSVYVSIQIEEMYNDNTICKPNLSTVFEATKAV